MTRLPNSDILKTTLEALFTVSGRRTLKSFTVMVINTVLKRLKKEYTFLNYIEIKDVAFSEGGVSINVSSEIDKLEPKELGKAIDAIIRIVYMDLGTNAGTFFITELKEYLGNRYTFEIENLGVNLNKIQNDQHEIFNQRERTQPIKKQGIKKEEKGLQTYSWDNVSTWEYDNNVCFLYDKQGNILDKLELDILVEDYVNRISEIKEDETDTMLTRMIKVNEMDNQLLNMLRQKDMDFDLALHMLDISEQKLNAMINKLIDLEMLQHTSFDEVKITEKGINHLKTIKNEETI